MAKSVTQKRRREAEADQESRHETEVVEATEGETQQTTAAPPSKKARVEERRSIFVRSLPPTATSEKLTEFFSEHFPIKHATVVTDPKTKTSRGYGFVTFTDAEDAQAAKEKLDNELLDGRRLRLDIAEPRHRPGVGASAGKFSGGAAGAAAIASKKKREEELAEARKAPKLIVRNLPWSIKKSEDLSALFRMYGKVKFADLPQSKGKMAGFGFVTLRGRKNAEAALAAINGKVVDGRTLAVDWAVDKQTWDQQQEPQEKTETASAKESKKEKTEKTEKAEKKEKKDEADEEADEDMRNFMKNVMQNLEDEESDEDKEKDDDDEDDEDKDADEKDSEWEDDEAEKAPKKELSTDNSSTVFIRNLPFTTTDSGLKDHFSKFGAVRYARIVMDRATDRPAGTGFVCFFDADVAQECVRRAPRLTKPGGAAAAAAAAAGGPAANAAALGKRSVLQDERVDSDGRYTLEGRVLQVARAVSKTEAEQLSTDGPGAQRQRERDKRRVFLLSEGTIARGSALYDQLPPNEIQMREASAKQRLALVKGNPSLHLSLTRLAVRNIPRHIDSKGLKELARRAIVGFATDVKNGQREPLSREELARGGQMDREAEQRRRAKGVGVVKQAKVIFETEQGSKMAEDAAKGKDTKDGKDDKSKESGGRSRGYGFIEYWSHRWALTGLRWLNGYSVRSQDGSKTHRLIVEFAIENANVVARRKANEERSRNPRAPKSEDKEKEGKIKEEKEGKHRHSKFNKASKPDKADKAKKADQSTQETAEPVKSAKKAKADAKLAMRQQIIGRKRMVRKKKAVARKGA